MFDVAVIGAGPSGSWTAYLLAAQGARVALIDGSHPREKPCGGGVTGRALALVAPVLPDLLDAGTRIGSARFVHAASARACTVPLGDEGTSSLLVASRRSFDLKLLALARDAGAELRPARATDIVRAGSGYRVQLQTGHAVAARTIVGADGVTSLVRRRFAVPFRRDQLSIAAGFFVYGPIRTEIVIEFAADPAGYFWSFPRPDHLAVGVCTQADAGETAGRLKARTADWIRATGLGADGRWQPYSWPIPSLNAGDLAQLTLAGDDWCLVGDAAGLVDPITREGIYFSLRSAALAADAVGGGHLRGYASRVRAEIVSELARAARLKAGFFTPHFTRLVMDALGESPAVRRVMADLITGTQLYRGLAWRLLSTLEVGLACRLAVATARRTRAGHAPGRLAD